MAEPTLDDLIMAQQNRKPARVNGLLDLMWQYLYPKPQAPLNQPLAPVASGQQQPRTLDDVLFPKR